VKTTSEVNAAMLPGGKVTRVVRIGTVSFSIAEDETKAARLALDAAGHALLSADRGRCGASLALLELAPGAVNTQVKGVRLVTEKARGKASRRRLEDDR
jgi:hypothetical protein